MLISRGNRAAAIAAYAAVLLAAGCDGSLGRRGEKLPAAAAGDTVTIASFNIQVFGPEDKHPADEVL